MYPRKYVREKNEKFRIVEKILHKTSSCIITSWKRAWGREHWFEKMLRFFCPQTVNARKNGWDCWLASCEAQRNKKNIHRVVVIVADRAVEPPDNNINGTLNFLRLLHSRFLFFVKVSIEPRLKVNKRVNCRLCVFKIIFLKLFKNLNRFKPWKLPTPNFNFNFFIFKITC